MSTETALVTQQDALLDNRTGLPDHVVQQAVRDAFVDSELAATEGGMIGSGRIDRFRTYSSTGSLLARDKFDAPTSVRDEIIMSREWAATDEDIGGAIDQLIAIAFESGMRNLHPDEPTTTIFNEAAKLADFDASFPEMYREWLITGQVNTVQLYQRQTVSYTPEGGDGRSRKDYSIAMPRVGILPAENIIVLDTDLFGTSRLAFDPGDNSPALKDWLDEYFAPGTSAARKAEMKKADPVSAAMFVEPVEVDSDAASILGSKETVYILNAGMVARSTMPKGASPHPRPLITRAAPLLEAKRLLNLLDHALLQGGIGFIVIAKKGSEALPALPEEILGLQNTMRRASRSGVIVGDHRLNIEIITPKLDEMLKPERRQMIGRKLAMAILRLTESSTDNPGTAGKTGEMEFLARIIGMDRRRLKRHVEKIYSDIVKRNSTIFKFGAPKIWFPRIVLADTQYFTDYVIKLFDRGKMSAKSMVEAGGFDYDSELEQRRRETLRGDPDVMIPPSLPYSTQDAGPQDNNTGRPPGSRTGGGGQDPAAPKPPAQRLPGETVRAMYEGGENGAGAYNIGTVTHAILEQFADTSHIGKISAWEREALAEEHAAVNRGLVVVPVNRRWAFTPNLKVLRLTEGASMFVGRRALDQAIMAYAIAFREPDYTVEKAIETANRWGFPVDSIEQPEPSTTE